MDWVRLLSGTTTPRIIIIYLLLVVYLLMPASVQANWVAPVAGSGNFPISVDVVNRWRGEDRLDVLVLVAVANADLKYEMVGEKARAGIWLEVILEGPEDQQVKKKRKYRTEMLRLEDTMSPTMFQVFGLILEDVPFRFGRLVARVVDPKQRRPGFVNSLSRNLATSEAVADWWAPAGPRPDEAVALGDPFFLAHAPLSTWNPNQDAASSEGGFLQDYMHPARRYGLEQDHLQAFLPVWPTADAAGRADLPTGLRVQITSLDMQFTVEDTIDFDERGLEILRAGRPAGLVYELDVNLLPEGSYRMAIAPLGGRGRGLLSGFDVAWSLSAIGRHRERIMGEGRTVLTGDRLRDFEAASLPEKEAILDEFWAELNPDPENPVNEAQLEFQYRVAYATRFLGGFGVNGAEDARGRVFILLGPPADVERKSVPSNELDQNDAVVKVFEQYAPDREGHAAKGANPLSNPMSLQPSDSQGGIPMPYSYYAEIELFRSRGKASNNFGFELWRYDQGGRPLFANEYSADALGKRFLFVDRTGSGHFELRASNILQGGD